MSSIWAGVRPLAAPTTVGFLGAKKWKPQALIHQPIQAYVMEIVKLRNELVRHRKLTPR